MEFSFLHIADIHLDRPFSDLSEFSFESYKNTLIDVFNNIIDFAILKNVDFVLIAGDTFDSSEQDFSSKLALIKGFQKLNNADIMVYLVCGNHDPLNSYNKSTFKFSENSKTKIIGLNTPQYCELPLKNKNGEQVAKLHAFSFPDKKFNENPLKYFEKAKDGFNIGLLHCDVNADSFSPYAPCLLTDLKELNYDYFALGHIHLRSDFDQKIRYSGTIQGRNTKETGEHGVYYVKVSDNKIVKNSFIPTDIIRFENVSADISSVSSSVECFDIIEDKINEIISHNNAQIYFIKPCITGCCSCFSEINEEFFNLLSDKIKVDFQGRVFISKIECNIIPKIDDDTLNKDIGISGELFRTIENFEVLDNSFSDVSSSFKNLIDNCNFSLEEYEEFKKNIVNSAKEECKNISSVIYERAVDE